ncbi:DNA-binding response regulator [Frondihabitans sucicola]|uniref:DNA-binding response regulator n=1 Tax=Frondihabitans sucicola TaxID=1268041 RepID=A0ABN6Y3T1_9MICO|nr:response regulator transcription factor [Frondihabitans sucicola]BDZ50747.1 DNA-binding response regulator [Frondihabitans sucicola]
MAAVDGVIRVVLIDDEPLVRVGLRLVLGGDTSIEVVGEASDGIDGVALVARTDPDVALVDIRMPRLDGLEATRRILARDPAQKVIVLTTFDTDDAVVTALQLGASGFLLKDTPPAELVEAVRLVAGGRPMLSPAVTAKLIEVVTSHPDASARSGARARLDTLTDRERAVAVELARGRSNGEIARTLSVSVATVKTHLGRVFDKLDASNRVQVALVLRDAGIR